jgi:putative copper export protein
LTRGAADAALLSVLGAVLFRAWLAPSVLAIPFWDARTASRRIARIVSASLAAAAVLSALWVMLETADMAGSVRLLPEVLQETVFGHVVLARAALLVLTALAFAAGWRWAAVVFAALAVGSVAGHTHAFAMQDGPSWLLASDVLHLLAASSWLGGLLPLVVLVQAAPPGIAARASARFSVLGTVCVLALAVTAFWQSFELIGSIPGLVGTSYGLVALFKLGCFAVLLGFAARNRFLLTPALAGPLGITSKWRLVRSIAAEAGLGLVVVLAAGLLSSLTPAMHT